METEAKVAEKVAEDMIKEREKPKPENGKPAGVVEQKLTVQDRLLIINAVEAYWRGRAEKERDKSRGDYRGMNKITKVRRLLDVDGVDEYLEESADRINDETERWRDEVEAYNEWRQKGKPPGEDGKPMKRPSYRAPTKSDEEIAGPESTFQIPAKMYANIQEAVKEMDWGVKTERGAYLYVAEQVDALREKLGIKVDED